MTRAQRAGAGAVERLAGLHDAAAGVEGGAAGKKAGRGAVHFVDVQIVAGRAGGVAIDVQGAVVDEEIHRVLGPGLRQN